MSNTEKHEIDFLNSVNEVPIEAVLSERGHELQV